MMVFYRSKTKSSQSYEPVLNGAVLSAILYCPDCLSPILLTKNTIGPTGKVVPYVRCNYPGCSFHEPAQLEGWSGVYTQWLNNSLEI